jgi:hypothetical protein
MSVGCHGHVKRALIEGEAGKKRRGSPEEKMTGGSDNRHEW